VAVARARPQDSVRTTRALVLKRVEYGEVVDVLAAIRDAGWQDVALVTVERPGVN